MTTPQSPFTGIKSGESFRERVGEPDSFTSGLGYVVLAFSWLELLLSRYIAHLLGSTEAAGITVASELPFQKKVHLLASLVKLNPRNSYINGGRSNAAEAFESIVTECFRAEEMRNTLLHSSWELVPLEPQVMKRFKHTAKAKRGLIVQVDHVDDATLLDVAEYIDSASGSLEMFFAPRPV